MRDEASLAEQPAVLGSHLRRHRSVLDGSLPSPPLKQLSI
jgi:hypothetical protein